MKTLLKTALGASILLATSGAVIAQDESDIEKYATINKKYMMPMRDGVRLTSDIIIPKGMEGKKLPTIFWKTPYNMNKINGVRAKFAINFVKQGYAVIFQNERGRYFSEGDWDILGVPATDGYDAMSWIEQQPWSNGNVGATGCSSSAEWIMTLANQGHRALKAVVPMSPGAGIGKVGEYWEMGNWYRGGVDQIFYLPWMYGVQSSVKPRVPTGTSQADIQHMSQYYDLQPKLPKVDWKKAVWHLPYMNAMEAVDGPKRDIFKEMAMRKPNSKEWFEGSLYHEDNKFKVPGLWYFGWYDVSTSPNIELVNHVRQNGADANTRDNQYMVVAPLLHCRYYRDEGEIKVGEREVGDVTYDYFGLMNSFFDKHLKGDSKAWDAKHQAKNTYYTIGDNKWDSSDQWPPKAAQKITYYMDANKGANSLYGDGTLSTKKPSASLAMDSFTYDPKNPVMSLGGGICCAGGAVNGGIFDQRPSEARNDILVYSTEPLAKDTTVTGKVEVVLYVSSDAKDTDFMVKLVDVAPDGTAFNVDETAQRVRYREGYNKEVFMKEGEVYKVKVSSMSTSTTFKKGHRIRVEVTSSNFPRFLRNLNTGGNNYDESEGVVAHNNVHHTPDHPSHIVLPIMPN